MKRGLILLAACGAPPKTVTHTEEKPVALRLAVANDKGVGIWNLDGNELESWSTSDAGTMIGALPDHRGVVVMSFGGDVSIVEPHAQHPIGRVSMQMRCGAEGAASLSVKRASISPDGRAACMWMSTISTGEIQVQVTFDLGTGTEYQHEVGTAEDCGVNEQRAPAELHCEAPPRPQPKTLVVEGETFTLASISPTKRWEIYEGPRHRSSYESASMLVIDTIAKQRYAPISGAAWPPALQPGHKVENEWGSYPDVTWLTDDIASIDRYTLVELGKRTTAPGSHVRW